MGRLNPPRVTMQARFASVARQQGRLYATQANKTVQPPIQTYTLAGKYASAAYTAALSKSEQALKAVETDLGSIAGVMKTDKQIADFVQNPTLSAEDKQAGLAALLKSAGKYNEVTKNLFDVLQENGRLHDATKGIEEFQTIMSAHRGEVNITVTSAAPLDSSLQSRLEKSLKDSAAAKNGTAVKITNVVNPGVLGGLIVDFGDKSIDLSVQSKVQKMNALMQESV